MRASMVQMYLHVVWSTWDRTPLVTTDIEQQVYGTIIAEAKKHDCTSLAIGGIENHVHVLLRLGKRLDVPALVRDMKGASSHLVKTLRPKGFFRWQGSYGAFSVDPRSVDHIIAYIRNQRDHHEADTTSAYLEYYLSTTPEESEEQEQPEDEL